MQKFNSLKAKKARLFLLHKLSSMFEHEHLNSFPSPDPLLKKPVN